MYTTDNPAHIILKSMRSTTHENATFKEKYTKFSFPQK